jgi:hypothetical protein
VNRQQKREFERKANKITNWINTLTPEQERAINTVIDERVYKTTHSIEQALDTSVAAALNMKTDLNISEIEEILTIASDYMIDSKEFLLKYGSDWIMKINEIKPKIKEECIKLLDQNKNQADAVKALKEIFKDIPTKDLANIFKETKEEWCKKCPTIDKVNKAKLDEKEVSQASTPKKENESTVESIDKQNNTFEVVEKKLKFKGEYHEYEKDKNGLVAGIEIFKSLDEIEAYRIKETKEFENMIAEVRAAFTFEG